MGFSSFPGIGPVRFRMLLDHFGYAETAWHADASDLKESGIGNAIADQVVEFRNKFSISEYLQNLQKLKIKYLTCGDPGYPKLLREIKNPPIVLYYKGKFDFSALDKQTKIAVVGTRRITSYGIQVTSQIVTELVYARCIIISGLAFGVDSVAHAATIENKGTTIAVLGSGVDVCTPAENTSLYNKILESGGAIVSEAAPGQAALKGSFLSRNRIVAGLSDGVVVTEGASDSGALVTAECGLINNRKVFAIPGPVTSNYSKGPNSLLAKGVLMAKCAGDILKVFRLKNRNVNNNITSDIPEEQKIIDLLQNEQIHIDELIKKMKMSAAKLNTLLSIMEMKGIVRNSGSGLFALAEGVSQK